MTPPISAWLLIDGIPSSQVTRFQVIPPARPAATTVNVTSFVLTRPLAIVAATARERNAPTRLSAPDKATATRGPSAPVAIEVAIALPVSWNPLVKSKANAVTTTSASSESLPMIQVSNDHGSANRPAAECQSSRHPDDTEDSSGLPLD